MCRCRRICSGCTTGHPDSQRLIRPWVICAMQLAVEDSLQQLDTAQNRAILIAVGIVIFVALVLYTARALRARAAFRSLHQGIISVGIEHLHNVLVPDGNGAAMHIDYLLLTSR